MMPTQDIRKQVALALEAVNNKKAEDVALLQLPGESSTFTDYFLICSGSNARQVQAIADEVDERLSKDMGVEPNACWTMWISWCTSSTPSGAHITTWNGCGSLRTG
jgi:ribosome-associated protein